MAERIPGTPKRSSDFNSHFSTHKTQKDSYLESRCIHSYLSDNDYDDDEEFNSRFNCKTCNGYRLICVDYESVKERTLTQLNNYEDYFRSQECGEL